MDVRAVENVASRIGEMNLVHINAAIEKSEQTVLVTETLLQALISDNDRLAIIRNLSLDI